MASSLWSPTRTRCALRFALTGAALLCVSSLAQAQAARPAPAPAPAPSGPSPALIERSARRIVAAARYAALVTLDERGAPRARVVQPIAPTAEWVVWFATNPRTRKVQDIARDGRVVLQWFDAASFSYVSLNGRARVVRDRAEKAAHWDRAWDAFYADRDTSVVLIEVRADELEVVSEKDGVTGDKATWRPPVLPIRKR
ncbi:MAG: pyridoxamine 5'-phosphate oxidase family protein [Gemmatimonadetes bacterium]|nr:pyridoxamine 5'-phosphate oxidase family protein [Gemmatimonadota bacterium]